MKERILFISQPGFKTELTMEGVFRLESVISLLKLETFSVVPVHFDGSLQHARFQKWKKVSACHSAQTVVNMFSLGIILLKFLFSYRPLLLGMAFQISTKMITCISSRRWDTLYHRKKTFQISCLFSCIPSFQ